MRRFICSGSWPLFTSRYRAPRRGDSAGGELFAFLHGGGADGTADRHGTV